MVNPVGASFFPQAENKMPAIKQTADNFEKDFMRMMCIRKFQNGQSWLDRLSIYI